MTDVFVLGAGFSMAVASPAMPSTDELGERALEILRALHHAIPRVHSDNCDGISCDQPQLVDGRIPAPTFEILMSRLAEPQPYLMPSENDRARALFRELTGAVELAIRLATIQACEQVIPSPDWFPQIVRLWHERRADVVTFNYDTLVEAQLDTMRLLNERDQPIEHLNIGPRLIPYFQSYGGGQLRMPTYKSFRYMKLHGSIEWYWDDTTRSAESMVEIGLPARWGEAPDPDWQPSERAPGKAPIIVPPTTTKTKFFTNPVIRALWNSAFKSVRAATRLFFVGYSLPSEDLLVSSMLRDATRDVAPIPCWAVNLDPRVADRLELAGLHADRAFTGGTDVIGAFVDWYAQS